MIKLTKKDVKVETFRGSGPGGQLKNKLDSCVRMTHRATGVSVTVDGRSQAQNKKKARRLLEEKLMQIVAERRAEERKKKRDENIQPGKWRRTYNLHSGVVTDHRTGKKAAAKDVLDKGRLDLLQ